MRRKTALQHLGMLLATTLFQYLTKCYLITRKLQNTIISMAAGILFWSTYLFYQGSDLELASSLWTRLVISRRWLTLAAIRHDPYPLILLPAWPKTHLTSADVPRDLDSWLVFALFRCHDLLQQPHHHVQQLSLPSWSKEQNQTHNWGSVSKRSMTSNSWKIPKLQWKKGQVQRVNLANIFLQSSCMKVLYLLFLVIIVRNKHNPIYTGLFWLYRYWAIYSPV